MCDSNTTHQNNNSHQAFPTMVPLRATFRSIPCLILPCGKRQHDGRRPCGSGFGSKPRPQLFCENLGAVPLHTRSLRPAVSATENGGGCGPSPRPHLQQRQALLTEPPGTEEGEIPHRIFRMQRCTSLLDAEIIICRLHCSFSEGTHGATALAVSLSITFLENSSIFFTNRCSSFFQSLLIFDSSVEEHQAGLAIISEVGFHTCNVA